MRVHVVHSREIDAPPERVGALLDTLGSGRDELWPRRRWSTLPFALDGPLAVGTPARHGPIRYAVDRHEPGRRLVFRFAPGLGLVGTHGWEVEPLGERRARLTHALDGRVEPKLLALWPVVRGYHDALSEDVLAQAERAATGRDVPDPRWPLWLRVVNGAEERLARGSRVASRGAGLLSGIAAPAALVVPAVVAGLAALHGAWALGWRWPGGSDRELAERIIGTGGELPPAWATWGVAIALGGAAAVVRTAAGGHPSPVARRLTQVIAAVFLLRGVVSVPIDLVRGLDGHFERLDLAIYSPLCVALGLGAAAVAHRATLATTTTTTTTTPAAA